MYKKIFLVIVLCWCKCISIAQNEITQFLGIPIEGTKLEMLDKIRTKGFVSTTIDTNILEGEFNGNKVYIGVSSKNNKANRVIVTNQNTYDKINARIAFNSLCNQFAINPKYTSILSIEDMLIPENVDIIQAMINGKSYEAMFYQNVDSATISKQVLDLVGSRFSQEELNSVNKQNDIKNLISTYTLAIMYKKAVWFKLKEYKGQFSIILVYETEALNEELGDM